MQTEVVRNLVIGHDCGEPMGEQTNESKAPHLPDDLSYEDWISFIFDHPVMDPQWWCHTPDSGLYQYWNEEADPSGTLAYLTRLFSSPSFLIPRFSRAQIDQGLYYIVSSGCSSHMFVLATQSLPWADRKRCILAIFDLFRDLIAPVYGNDLSSGSNSKSNHNRPTHTCFMWWDIIPLPVNTPESSLIIDAVASVLDQILTLDSEACLESGMHGVSEFHFSNPKRFEEVGLNFLKRKDISYRLRSYAQDAAFGRVL